MAFPDPSLTPPDIANWQWSYNGLTMGADTPYGVLTAEGHDLASIVSGDVGIPRDHGEFMGLDLFRGRDPILDFWIKSDGTSVQHAQLALAAASNVQPNVEMPLWFQLPTLPLLCIMCRPRKRPFKIDANYAAANIAQPSLTLHATDPRMYTAGSSVDVSLGSPDGGLGPFPVGGGSALPFPLTFGVFVPGAETVTNTGIMETRPIVIFTGPLTGPSIQNLTAPGEPLVAFINPFDSPTLDPFTVLPGDQLLVDFASPHRVLYYSGGIAAGLPPQPEGGWVTFSSTWWTLLPGDNDLVFRSRDSTDTGGTCTIQWASAYQL